MRGRTSLVLLLGLLLASSPGFGGRLELLADLDGARSQVIYVGTYLRDRMVAQSLLSLLNRGGKVYLYVYPPAFEDRKSYFLSLYWAGAQVYLTSFPRYYLLIDGQILYAGPSLEKLEKVQGEKAKGYLRELESILQRAAPLRESPVDFLWHWLR